MSLHGYEKSLGGGHQVRCDAHRQKTHGTEGGICRSERDFHTHLHFGRSCSEAGLGGATTRAVNSRSAGP
eukprot:7354168-Pyramimonas_sp.AAC.1